MGKKIIGMVLTVFICLGFGFVSASRVSEIIQYHFQLSTINGVASDAINNENITNDIWYLILQCDNYIKEDLGILLNKESTRRSNLNIYIADGNALLNALGYQKNKLNNQLQTTATKIQGCQNQFTNANQRYITSINAKNEIGFNQAVNMAKLAKKCISEEQVEQSAINTLLKQVQNYTTKIQRRNEYLKNNQSLILRHYDILKPSLLRELYSISVQLEK